ncbi:MAG TPA: gamma-glutamyl-gamma-aminobutyrate hydrolase family protein [Cyclobacteriaceae bacterium]
MKKVGITNTSNIENYIKWFNDSGNDIEVLKLEVGSNDYKGCAGIVLSGGTDVHPDLYDGDLDYENKPKAWDEKRDEYEQEVYKYAKMNKVPILAICRGLQLVNAVEGGTMIQDLDDGNTIHKKENDVDKQHTVVVDSRTLLGDVTGGMKETVNSAHHQAVEFPGNALIENARSDDGVIEGLEFKDKIKHGFLLCVQWHPERIPDNLKMSKNIKKAFLSAIRSI